LKKARHAGFAVQRKIPFNIASESQGTHTGESVEEANSALFFF
jgi:hypothetical protein